ncbi:helix-turn-helix domain-containing protein [Geopseudomonas sagittaria]|uniref:helix-turn-helix domain-containing protein n=1 Tax=Geopseudomonas sagittaria TaxID=1135990 RepID=UPI000B832CC9
MTLIDVPQTAKFLGVCRQTVYNMIKAGEIPFVMVRSHYRIPREKLVSQLAAEPTASISSAGGVAEESTCRTNETIRPIGGSASKHQLDATLDGLLGPTTKRQRQR